MKQIPLLAVNKLDKKTLTSNEVTLHSTLFPRELPSQGLTMAMGVATYNKIIAELEDKTDVQVCTINYIGHREISNTYSNVTPDMVSKSNYIRLSELSSESFEPIHAAVKTWIMDKSQTNKDLVDELHSSGYLKPSTSIDRIRIKLTATQNIIAENPEIVDAIHNLPEFNHLDAIAYKAKIGEYTEELITIFSDENVAKDDLAKQPNHVKGAISNFSGYIILPSEVSQSGKMETVEERQAKGNLY